MTVIVEWKSGKVDIFPNVVTCDREPRGEWFKINLENQSHDIHITFVNKLTILKGANYEIRN